MTDIRELLTEASTSVDVGPADPVGLVREGLSRRRRTQAAIVGVVAAVATAIAVPVVVTGSSKTAPIAVGPTHRWASVVLYEVVDARHPAQHTRFVSLGKTRVEIRRAPSIALNATAAAVKHGPSGWQVWLAAPESNDLYQQVSQPAAPSFIGVLLGRVYRADSVMVGQYHDVVLLPFPSKQLALAAAERLAPIVSYPVTATLPPQCTPNVKNCKRFVRRMQRMIRNQRQADHHRGGH